MRYGTTPTTLEQSNATKSRQSRALRYGMQALGQCNIPSLCVCADRPVKMTPFMSKLPFVLRVDFCRCAFRTFRKGRSPHRHDGAKTTCGPTRNARGNKMFCAPFIGQSVDSPSTCPEPTLLSSVRPFDSSEPRRISVEGVQAKGINPSDPSY